jgi:hypothetical protein
MRELEVVLDDKTSEESVTKDITAALENDSVLWLTDKKGRRFGIPGARIAYVEFGSANAERQVGFGL